MTCVQMGFWGCPSLLSPHKTQRRKSEVLLFLKSSRYCKILPMPGAGVVGQKPSAIDKADFSELLSW